MSKLLVFGKNGQVGSQLSKQLENRANCVGRVDVDMLDLPALQKYLENLSEVPNAIIDAVAYTQVDKAEGDGKNDNYILNTKVPVVLAEYCKKKDIPFVYYTTDYVFDGEGSNPFSEDDEDHLHPIGEYGKSKLEAEKEINKIGGKYLIFRTSWVYNETGKNFVHTMLRLGSDKEELNVVSDQVGSPTYAYDIAKYTIEALDTAQKMDKFPTGIYHLVNNGFTNWNEFAVKIFDIARRKGVKLAIKKVNAIKTSEYPTPAKRPLNSRLSTEKLNNIFGIKLRSWEDALVDCLNKILTK